VLGPMDMRRPTPTSMKIQPEKICQPQLLVVLNPGYFDARTTAR